MATIGMAGPAARACMMSSAPSVPGMFMSALTEKRIVGIRNGDAVLVPPMEWDPATGAELAHDFVEVGPAGTVESWTWVPCPSEQHPLDHAFAFVDTVTFWVNTDYDGTSYKLLYKGKVAADGIKFSFGTEEGSWGAEMTAVKGS